MASGDTKTEALLNILGSGGDASGYRGCCNTKSQAYILDAIDRVQTLQDDVDELRNNPDVVDIVDTYADLQAYDTQHLTDNDIIRVLNDETHGGNSTYYRLTKNPDTWTFIGEIPSGGGTMELTLADLNYPANNPQYIALWLLPQGIYTVSDSNVRNRIIAFASGSTPVELDEASAYVITDSVVPGGDESQALKEITSIDGKPDSVGYIFRVLYSSGEVIEQDKLALEGELSNYVYSTNVHTVWSGTQAQYDAITNKDNSTLYIITGA